MMQPSWKPTTEETNKLNHPQHPKKKPTTNQPTPIRSKTTKPPLENYQSIRNFFKNMDEKSQNQTQQLKIGTQQTSNNNQQANQQQPPPTRAPPMKPTIPNNLKTTKKPTTTIGTEETNINKQHNNQPQITTNQKPLVKKPNPEKCKKLQPPTDIKSFLARKNQK